MALSPKMAAILAARKKQNSSETSSETRQEVKQATFAENYKQPPATKPATLPATGISKLQALLAKRQQAETEKARAAGQIEEDEELIITATVVTEEDVSESTGQTSVGMHGEVITYNPEQQRFVSLAGAGESCVLIGPAGTGKTTCSKGGISELIASNKVQPLVNDGHKYLPNGTPGVVIISYTRRAVNNIRKVQPKELKDNCITAHKLLEYQPEYFEVEDPATGSTKRTMQFLPSRTSANMLPSSIGCIVVEEASMLSVELYNEIASAVSDSIQWIFIGDIQQLPPVFGSAILGFKMLELPVVELTQVYRQALESPIIRLAHRILSGKPIPAKEFDEWEFTGQLKLHPWKKKLTDEDANRTLAAFLKALFTHDKYDANEDIILIPYNKACGCIEINKHIANFLARHRNATTYEVMAGFNKHYFSEGDRVLYDKEDAIITKIERNPTYAGKRVQAPSKELDYWGHNHGNTVELDESSPMDVDALLESFAEAEDRVTQASHIITVQLDNSMANLELKKAAEINNLLHGYAITIHKSQGSEWRKVFFFLHHSHAKMLQRELLYTGVTRAREELYVICEPDSFVKGITNQKIKGNTLAEKAEFFKGKIDRGDY